jgi:ParB family chromosome partitioning protein
VKASVARTADISVAKIIPNPNQPRKLFDEEALLELADSIAKYGLLQRLIVRPAESGYQIIAGERRWRAAKIAGLTRVPVEILRDVSDELAFILSTLENVARADMTVIEEANAYAQVMATGLTSEEVAKLFGKTPQMIAFRLSLLNLRDDIQHLVARGQIQKWLAIQLARLGPDEQGEVLRKYQTGELATEQDAARYASAIVARQAQADLFVVPEPDEFVKHQRKETRKQFEREMEKLSKLTSSFSTVLELDPCGLADALGADVDRWAAVATEVSRLAGRVNTMMQNAAAHYAVSLEEMYGH